MLLVYYVSVEMKIRKTYAEGLDKAWNYVSRARDSQVRAFSDARA